MSTSDDPPVSQQTLDLFQDLQQAVQEEDHRRIVKTIAPALLFEDRLDQERDGDILMVVYDLYVKAMLEEEEYEPVVELLSHTTRNGSHNKKQPQPRDNNSRKPWVPYSIAQRLEPQRIYAMYRLERYEAAQQQAAAAASPPTTALQHLQAQSLYHLQDYRGAQSMYDDLLSSTNDDASLDDQQQLLTNVVALPCAHMLPYTRPHDALAAQRSTLEHVLEVSGGGGEYAADLMYNMATYDLGTSHSTTTTAASLLHQAMNATRAQGQEQEWTPEQLHKELSPMEWNLEWSRLLWQGATTSSSSQSTSSSSGASQSARLVALANQALSAHHKPSDAVRLLPKPQAKLWSPFQNHLLFYNRAVLHYRAHQYDQCQSTCHEWSHCIQGIGSSSGSNNKVKKQTPTMPEKGKIKLLCSPLEALWWGSRIAVLEALCLLRGDKDKKALTPAATKRLKDQLELVQTMQQKQQDKEGDTNSNEVLDHLSLYLCTHLAAVEHNNPHLPPEKILSVLQSLPAALQNENAVVATMASLYHKQGKEEQSYQLLKDSGHEEALADFLLTQERYQEVVDLLQDKTDVVSRARYVQALSHVDPERAHQVWTEELQPQLESDPAEDLSSSLVNGSQLELKELPRLKSHRSRHSTSQFTSESLNTTTNNKKKSHEAVLRQRARKREAYLADRQQRGLPVTQHPDPERWLPKYERSYNRRRRNRQQQQYKGAQGGVSDKDAAKLDVAARKAARASGEAVNDGRSTAHIKAVSSGGPARKGGKRRS